MWLEQKYANLLSNRFDRFSVKNNTFNFRCPYCGDSEKNKFKARGYLWDKGKGMVYFCHNCGVTRTFNNFLKEQDQMLHKQFVLEKLKDGSAELAFGTGRPSGIVMEYERTQSVAPVPKTQARDSGKYSSGEPLTNLRLIANLRDDHPAKQYILQRKIPSKYMEKMFYCTKFKAWTNTMVPGKFNEENDEPRIIIPFIDEKGSFFGYQGRALGKSLTRYITIMLEPRPNMFGLDDVDFARTVYVTEGPFDSMFLANSVAMAGSDLNVEIPDPVMIYDNEPRNYAIVNKIKKSIAQGKKVVIWPSHIEHKDINDMVLNGLDVMDLVQNNTFKGLRAEMAVSQWSKNNARVQSKNKKSS